MAVVVDLSTLPGGSPEPSVTCVNVSNRATGIDALRARAERLNVPGPRFNDSGLLCAIDGSPSAPACGEMGPDGYEYWGYYWGGTEWSFADRGPGAKRMTDKWVEGWAFQNGSNGGQPRTLPDFATLTNG